MMSKSNLTGEVSSLAVERWDKRSLKFAVKASAYFLLGLLSSRAVIFGKCAPFGIAAVAASPPINGIFILLGVVVGNMLPYGAQYSLRYVAAAAAVFAFKWLLSDFSDFSSHKAFAPVLASGSCLITGFAVVVTGGGLYYGSIILLAETLLCGCSVVFFEGAFKAFDNPKELWSLSPQLLVSVTITFCVILLALEPLQFAGISLGRIAGIIIVLIAARYGRESAGAVSGISAGIILSLTGGNMSHILAGYGFGGLIAGVFAPLGRFACAASFILANLITNISLGGSSAALTGSFETVAAAVAFLVLPESLLCRISGALVPSYGDDGGKVKSECALNQLKASSQALNEIAHTIRQVNYKLKGMQNDDISVIFDEASNIVCKSCGMCMYCWNTVYDDTMGVLGSLSDKLQHGGTAAREDVPDYFAAHCCKLNDLLFAVNRCYGQYAARRAASLRTQQIRELLTGEIQNTALILSSIADDFADNTRSEDGGDRIKPAFAACGLSVANSCVCTDTHGHMTVHAWIDGSSVSRINSSELRDSLSKVCGEPLCGPKILDEPETGRLHMQFTRRPEFSISFGAAAIRKTGETLCGDACESFVDSHGRGGYEYLSDGMGSGGAAANGR